MPQISYTVANERTNASPRTGGRVGSVTAVFNTWCRDCALNRIRHRTGEVTPGGAPVEAKGSCLPNQPTYAVRPREELKPLRFGTVPEWSDDLVHFRCCACQCNEIVRVETLHARLECCRNCLVPRLPTIATTGTEGASSLIVGGAVIPSVSERVLWRPVDTTVGYLKDAPGVQLDRRRRRAPGQDRDGQVSSLVLPPAVRSLAVLEHRASAGWADARTAQGAQRPSASPECRERSEASDRPRSGQRARSGSGAVRPRTLQYAKSTVQPPVEATESASTSIGGHACPREATDDDVRKAIEEVERQ